MGKHKIGRNAPCPCGSGKKYKHCCERLETITSVTADPFVRYSELMIALKLKLDRFFEQDIKKSRRWLSSRFMRFAVDNTLPREHESIFSDWVWFDVAGDKGAMGEMYFNDNGPYLEAPLRNALNSLNQSYLAIYEVTGYRDMHLFIRDLLTGEATSTLMKEPLDMESQANTVLLLGRLVRLPEDNIFSGMVLMVEDDALQKDFLCSYATYLADLYPEKIKEIRKQMGEVFYGIFDHAQKKTLLKLGDIRAIFHDGNPEDIADRFIQNCPEYAVLHNTGGWTWIAVEDGSGPYARITVGPRIILSSADVLDDVIKQQKGLEQLCLPAPLQLVGSHLYNAPPEPQWVDAWYLITKDRETERWLDTSHDELESLTPRQILGEPNGCQTLANLLDRFAATVTTDEELDLIEYMKARIQCAK